MKVKNIGSNQTQVEFENGVQVLVSYQTNVAAKHTSQGNLRAEGKWSQTTTKHINQWGCKDAKVVPQKVIDNLVNNNGGLK